MARLDRIPFMAPMLVDDRHEVLRPIGAGAMTRVLEAWDRRDQRRVALKVPIQGLAEDAAFLERLEFEARTAASLVHPNIAAVHEMGWDSGTGFVVTELVDGSSLGNMLIARGPLPAVGAAKIAISVCAAIAAAHARGVVHGHLTSSNVLLGIDGHVKVTDFRLAQAARPSDGAPDPADDLAGLGRCLAVMLTGRELAVGAPMGLGPEVPAELAMLAQHLIGDRQSPCGSAAELVHQLNRFLAGVRPGIGHTAPTTPDAPRRKLVVAAPPLRSTGRLVPIAAARPAPGGMATKEPSVRRRALTLVTAALVVGCLGAAAGLPIRRPPELLDNQAVPASTVILAPTASTPATSQASATTSSTTTVADAAATPEASQLPTTSGQVISSGQRIVPALAGLHRKQVADVLAQAQLGVQMIPIHVSDSRQVQQVVGQRPSAGHILPAGSAVTVLIGSRRRTA
jgi:serine/threonine protein kinase